MEANGADDTVEFAFAAVGEMNKVSAIARNIWPRTDAAVLHVVKQLAIQCWMSLENLVIGAGKTVVLIFSDDNTQHQADKKRWAQTGNQGCINSGSGMPNNVF